MYVFMYVCMHYIYIYSLHGSIGSCELFRLFVGDKFYLLYAIQILRWPIRARQKLSFDWTKLSFDCTKLSFHWTSFLSVAQ